MVNILWLSPTAGSSLEAAAIAHEMSDVAITDSVILHQSNKNNSRYQVSTLGANASKKFNWNPHNSLDALPAETWSHIDIVVDATPPEHLDTVVDLACQNEKPLIKTVCGLRLSDRQMTKLRHAASRIPLFYSTHLMNELRDFVSLTGPKITTEYILKIAKIMATKPAGTLHKLERLWPELNA